MGLQTEVLNLKDRFATLVEATINLIAEVAVFPLMNDCRKLAEFSLPKKICDCTISLSGKKIRIENEIVRFIESQGLKVEVTAPLLTAGPAREERRDFFVFKRQEYFDEFVNSLIEFGRCNITQRECAQRIGKLFGYSDESIGKYLARPNDIWPSESDRGYFTGKFWSIEN
jgi:hypothetical protein